MIRIEFGKIRMRVMQLVRLAKVCKRHHAWEQRDASPPEVRGFGATEMTMHALMGHHRADKDQIGAQSNVNRHQQGIRKRNEERAY